MLLRPVLTDLLKRKLKKYLLGGGLMLVCLIAQRVLGVEPVSAFTSRSWQTDEGLPNNSVEAIAQTQDGYLWVGTPTGLARFDGVAFTVFDTNNTPSLKDHWITALCPSRDGCLWIGTAGGGLTQWKGNRFLHHALGEDRRARHVMSLLERADGSLWAATQAGLLQYQGGTWSHLALGNALAGRLARALCGIQDEAWIGTSSGLLVWKHGKTRNESELNNEFIRTVFADRKGDLWIAMRKGLGCLKENRLRLYTRKDGLPDENVTAGYEDRHGNLWIGTADGLSRLRGDKFVTERQTDGSSFARVNCFFEDGEGTLWVGTTDGLHQLCAKRFVTYTRREGLAHDNVMSVLEDRGGNIWLGTRGGGLSRLKDETVVNFTKADHETEGLTTDSLLALCEDRDGSLLVSADYADGIFRFSDRKFIHYAPEWKLRDSVIKVFCCDRQGNVWLGANNRLVLWNTMEIWNEGRIVRCLLEDHAGNLWVGAGNGLLCRKQDGFIRFTTRDGLSDDAVTAIYEDKERVLWLGTARGGLNRFSNGKFTCYSIAQGLFSNQIGEILEDDQGWLWMSCLRGVFRVRKEDLARFDAGEIKNLACLAYGKEDGLVTVQCNDFAKPAAWKSRDGRLWFATSKGVAVIDPRSEASFNPLPPPVYIEKVMADQKLVTIPEGPAATETSHPARDAARVTVPAGRGELEFHFTGLSYRAPEKVRFKYMLENMDVEWTEAGARRVAAYHLVSPGEYRFRVTGCNKDGIWNEAGAEVSITVLPHFWQTLWFRLSLAGFFLGMVVCSVYFVSTRKLQRQMRFIEQQHATEQERGRIARDIHDDMGAQLTEILLLNDLARRSRDNAVEREQYLAKQAHVAQEVARSVDGIIWAVNPLNDTLPRTANYLCEQVEMFLSSSSVRCRLDVLAGLPERSISSDMRHNIFLTVKESLNNVIKHAQATEVLFRLAVDHADLLIAIEDNGKGFAMSEVSSFANGLHNMEKRIQDIGGSFVLASAPGQGTRIRIQVPLGGKL